MAISQATVTLRNGQPELEITIPFTPPPAPTALPGSAPNVSNLNINISTVGGSLAGGVIRFYFLVSIDGSGNRSGLSLPLEADVPLGTSTNQVTLSGPANIFDENAVSYEVYASDGTPNAPGRISGPTGVPAPTGTISINDPGATPSATILGPDDVYYGTRVYWRKQGEAIWRFGAETVDRTQGSIKFQVPYNVDALVLEMQLRPFGPDGTELPPQACPVLTYTITGALGSQINFGGAVQEWQLSEGGSGVLAFNGTDFVDRNIIIANTFRNNPVDTSNGPTSQPLSQSGTTTQINVASSIYKFGSGTKSYNSGSVNPGTFGKYNTTADDPSYAGGSVTYQALTSSADVTAARGRLYFGTITTVGGGGGSGSGGGSGGCVLVGTGLRMPDGRLVLAEKSLGVELLTPYGPAIVERVEIIVDQELFMLCPRDPGDCGIPDFFPLICSGFHVVRNWGHWLNVKDVHEGAHGVKLWVEGSDVGRPAKIKKGDRLGNVVRIHLKEHHIYSASGVWSHNSLKF